MPRKNKQRMSTNYNDSETSEPQYIKDDEGSAQHDDSGNFTYSQVELTNFLKGLRDIIDTATIVNTEKLSQLLNQDFREQRQQPIFVINQPPTESRGNPQTDQTFNYLLSSYVFFKEEPVVNAAIPEKVKEP